MNENDGYGAAFSGGSSGKPRWWRPRWVLPVVAVAVLMALAIAAFPRTRTIEEFPEPKHVADQAGSWQVTAVLVHEHSWLAPLGIGPDRYTVILGGGAASHYGHRVRLHVTGGDPSDLTVSWEADGAWIEYTSGHRVFVPADAYRGGR